MLETAPLRELQSKVEIFCSERDWDQFHNLKDLSLALSIEVSELLEHLRWKNPKEVDALLQDPAKREEVEDEVADIFFFVLRIAQRFSIDLPTALERKIAKNAAKYPIEKARGSSKKYSEL